MNKPLVSVLMPVFNGDKYLKAAINSILHQTYSKFEFIIINDGSKDETAKLLTEFEKKDNRIIKVTHSKNLGIVVSLNEGLKLSKGKYILRMDADDIALQNRFEEQIGFMEEHPNVGVCGTWIEVMTTKSYIWRPPITNIDIQASLFFESVIAHPTACIRKAALDESIIKYKQDYLYVEDYKLWIDISKKWQLANIPEVLLKYRSHPNQISVLKGIEQSTNLLKLKASLLEEIYPNATKKEVVIHLLAMSWPNVTTDKELQKLKRWYKLLIYRNKLTSRYPNQIFKNKIAEKWVGICYLAKKLGLKRYLYIFSVPQLVLPAIKIVIIMKVYSIKEYIKATIRRFI